MLERFLDKICRYLNYLTAMALAVMVVLVFGNVVMRYGFNSGITVSEELSRWLFVWLTFLGAAVAVKENGHLGTEFVLVKLPPKAQRACLVVSHVTMIYITWLMLHGSWAQVQINRDVEAPVTGTSMGIFYASGVVFAAFTALMLLRSLWRLASGKVRDEELLNIQESEELAHIPGPTAAKP